MPSDSERPSDSESSERLAAQGRRLRLLVRHLTGPALRARIDPEDIVQETLLRAWVARASMPAPGDGEAALWAFLSRIARHAVVDAARAARAAKRCGRTERLLRSDWTRIGAGEPMARSAGPATRVVAAETQARLEQAFDRLSADHRRVIGLRQFAGLSAAETARRMGRSETAIHSLYRRALEAWEQAMGGGAPP